MRPRPHGLIVPFLALSALLFAAPAEASLTRATLPAVETPALTLTAAEPAPSEFSLFEGTELARAAAQSERATSFHPLAAVSLVSEDGAERPHVSVEDLSYPKTRYRVFELLGTPILGVERGVSLELHWRSASFSCGLASGTVGWLSQDPAGDQDSVNLYGFVGGRPHERTDAMGLSWTTFSYGVAEGAINLGLGLAQTLARQYLPAPLNGLNVGVNLTQPGKPMVSVSVPTVVEELKAATIVYPIGETLGRFGGNAYMTGQGLFDPTAPQDYLDEIHADLGRDTPGTVLSLAPLPKLLRAARGGEGAATAFSPRVGVNLAKPKTLTPKPAGVTFGPARGGGGSAAARAYAAQVTGGAEKAIYVNGTEFEGVDNGVLIDAKRAGASGSWYDVSGTDRFTMNVKIPDVIAQARRQLGAIQGTEFHGSRWVVADPVVASQLRTLFSQRGIPIEIVSTPAK